MLQDSKGYNFEVSKVDFSTHRYGHSLLEFEKINKGSYLK